MSGDNENLNLPLPTYDINSVLNEVEHLFLKPSNKIDKNNLSKYQRIVPIKEAPRIHDLTLGLEVQEFNTKLDLEFKRDVISNKIISFKQNAKSLDNDSSASIDQSFQRPIGKNYVRGSSNQVPFLPGGIEAKSDENIQELLQSRKNWQNYDEFINNLNNSSYEPIILEGFDRNLYLPEAISGGQSDLGGDDINNTLNLDYLFDEVNDKKFVDNLISNEEEDEDEEEDEEKEFDNLLNSNLKELELSKEGEEGEGAGISQDIDNLLPNNSEEFSLPSAPAPKARTDLKEWAHMVDLSTLPPDYEEVVPELAHPFPFELDIFQKQAIYHLENNDNVFVAAHTSAGKTVVAEYAIALAQNHMTRAIYTSPIKALSNQKFRDFSKTFPEVGILTGDVQIKPESTCLIMTTEILRSMLYQGADLIRDVEFVIFDEVHYLNDAERGVVWEEVIIMLPSHITIILLSATVPNTKEFAEWIGRTKKRDVFVISTLKRPVPLEHYLYCNKELFKVINQNKQFLPQGWKQASDHLTKRDKERPSNQGNKRGRGGHSNQVTRGGNTGGGKPFEKLDKSLWVHLIGTLKQKNLLPVVIFAFSRKKCEEFADQLPNTDLTSSTEKSEIHLFLRKSLIRLKGEDRLLPQILKVSEWISRGIAVHHGGLLPIVKEIVEILFSRGLIKILFATETFAMGVNMPTRTVVFSGIRKFTGTEYRDLLPGEYTQMSGRAGRRGLDTTGMVIIVSQGEEVPDTVTLTKMILGPSTQLESQFRLTYSMIITLLRVEAFKVEDMIKRSFSENANQKLLPNKQKLLDERQSELDNLKGLNCNICEKDLTSYYKKDSKVRELTKEVYELVLQSSISSKALSVGRVIIINNSIFRNCLAMILKSAGNLNKSGQSNNKGYYCLILTDKSNESNNKEFELNSNIQPLSNLEKPINPTYKVLPIPVKDFILISDINFQVNSDAIVDKKSELESLQQLQNLLILFDQLPLNEYDFKRLKLLKFQELNREKNELIQSLRNDYNCVKCPDYLTHFRLISEEETLREQLNDLYHVLSDQNLDLLPDYENRILVLMELNFIDDSMTVLLKGRVACEIKTADELLLTELILSNFFGSYTPEECVALLSCFIFQERLASEPNLTDNLIQGQKDILALAQTVGNIQVSKGVSISLEDYVQSFKFGLTEVVFEWAKGMTFKQITDLTTVQEGSIVRCMTRLNDLCRDVRNGARVIGDHSLYQKMEQASHCIKRDIVFAASLYL